MEISSVLELFQHLQTERVLLYLQNLDLKTLIHSPWFLGGTASVAVLCLIMRWRLLLTTIFGLSAFTALLSYTLERGQGLEQGLSTEPLLVFVAGGVLIIGLVIYFLFIRSD